MNYLIKHCGEKRSDKDHFYSVMSNNLNTTTDLNAQVADNMSIALREYAKLYVPVYPAITDADVNKYGSKIAKLLVYLNDSKVDDVIPKVKLYYYYHYY